MEIYIPQLWNQELSGKTLDSSQYPTKLYVDTTKISKSGDTMEGILNMSGNKIINVGTPEGNSDVTNVQYIKENVMRRKGGTFTGDLNMDNHHIKNVPNPVDNKDVCNKRYVDNLPRLTTLDRMGRYIRFNDEDGIISYVSVRAAKGIDLDTGKVTELKHLIDDPSSNIYKSSTDIEITSNFELLPGPKSQGSLGILNLLNPIRMTFTSYNENINPFSILGSFKSSDTGTPVIYPFSFIHIVLGTNNQPSMWVRFTFILPPVVMIELKESPSAQYHELHRDDLSGSTGLTHIAFSYGKNESCFYLNGRACGGGVKKAINGEILMIEISNPLHLGIFTLYNRKLDRGEIIEHHVDNHVANFTQDKIII